MVACNGHTTIFGSLTTVHHLSIPGAFTLFKLVAHQDPEKYTFDVTSLTIMVPRFFLKKALGISSTFFKEIETVSLLTISIKETTAWFSTTTKSKSKNLTK